MLKRTDRHLFPTTGILQFSRTLLGTCLVAGALALTTLTGCGNDTPQENSNETPNSDTSGSVKPGDTMAANMPQGGAAINDSSAMAGMSAGTMQSGTPGSANSGSASSTGGVTTIGKSAEPPGDIKMNVPPPPAITITEQNTRATRVSDRVGAGEETSYDPSIFDGLLRANVANAKVDYAAFKSSAEFGKFFQSLASASPDGMSTNDKLAFWINAYNACVIKNVNDNPGIKQPTDVAGFFDKKKFSVAGKQVTLNQIENEIVRPTFKEPLIHFGLVCAARSCPPLIAKTYTGANVLTQLAANAQAYLGDSKQNRYDAASKTLYLSKIFDWYKADFGGNDAGLIDFAKKHGPDAMKTALASASNVKVAFNEYDWTLNKK